MAKKLENNEVLATLITDGLGVTVKALQARRVFGRVEFLVEPVAGTGAKWAYAENLHFKNQSKRQILEEEWTKKTPIKPEKIKK